MAEHVSGADNNNRPGKPNPEDFTAEALADRVYNAFSSRNQQLFTHDEIARVVSDLNLNDSRAAPKSLSLRLRHLRFSGEKRLQGQEPRQFRYDQAFSSGVNVICIPDNEVGKSSILKTIKYGLTGDASHYDADVRSWITDVWLCFALDRQEFTMLLSSAGDIPHALLIPGRELQSIETAAEQTPLALFDVCGTEAIKSELQRFFFQRFGLHELSWTQGNSSIPGGVAQHSTTWLTYFQALEVSDAGDRYLLCDPQHAMGNQEGLIFSTFLGLNFTEPLNKLRVRQSFTEREDKTRKQSTTEQIQQAQQQIDQLEMELQGIQARLNELDASQTTRRETVERGEPAQQLIVNQASLAEKSSEKARLDTERNDLSQSIQRGRGRERQLNEVAALRLHFTGLEVNLCPNCDAEVGIEAIKREQSDHSCRLCSNGMDIANPDEVAALRAEAERIKNETDDAERGRHMITARIGVLNNEIGVLTQELDALTAAARQGIAFALPTLEEEYERKTLHEKVGRLQAELTLERQRANPPTEDDRLGLDVRLLNKVREVLGREADHRNQSLLERLSSLVQEMTHHIGAESISDVRCSPLGQVQLSKHGERVRFTGVQNEGERLRIKLAFFLGMMRLGREPGLGRHPGLLLIDQPGSSEMVSEDLKSLAGIFRRVDNDMAEDVQIICCTAREEFSAATALDKVYGPQDPPYAF